MLYLESMELWQAFILGIVQGITEFLPVSSSGHLVLARELLGVDQAAMLLFDLVLHGGTLLAVVVYFWRDLVQLAQTFFRRLGRLPINDRDRILFNALVIGTIPAASGGFLLQSFIESNLMSALSVAGGLVLAAVLFIYAEWRQYRHPATYPLTTKTGLLVGLFQACALIPGLSRSGTTIAGGMILGLSRLEATRFSFLLSIPLIAGAALYSALAIIGGEPVSFTVMSLIIGAVTAFLLALLVIHLFLGFVRHYTLWPFVWYSLALVVLVLYREFLV